MVGLGRGSDSQASLYEKMFEVAEQPHAWRRRERQGAYGQVYLSTERRLLNGDMEGEWEISGPRPAGERAWRLRGTGISGREGSNQRQEPTSMRHAPQGVQWDVSQIFTLLHGFL